MHAVGAGPPLPAPSLSQSPLPHQSRAPPTAGGASGDGHGEQLWVVVEEEQRLWQGSMGGHIATGIS